MSRTPLKGPDDGPRGRGYRSPDQAAIMFPRQEDLLTDPSAYEEIDVIGNGAYGTVYKARDLNNPSGQFVALKKVRVPLTDDGVPMSTLREISMLRQLERCQHRNIVRLLDICHGRRLEEEQQLVLILVFEHVEQDLHQFLERCPPEGLSQAQIRDLMFQTLCGVDFLHSNRIVHRDLKPQNILVTSNGVVKLADFGLARLYGFQMVLTSVVVTLWYRAPEVLLNTNYATPVDLWSVGCIFAELYLRKALFPGQTEVDQLSKIFDVIGTPKVEEWPRDIPFSLNSFRSRPPVPLRLIIPHIDPAAEDLLLSLLTFAPDSRISASRALSHPYFVGMNLPPPEDPSLMTHQPSPIAGHGAAAAGMTPTAVSGASAPPGLTMASTPIQTHRPPLHHLMVVDTPPQQSNRLSGGSTGSPSSSANSGPFSSSSSSTPDVSLSTTSDESGQSMEQ